VDVGYNQLAYRLRRDSRVGVHERSNIMTLELPEPQPHAAVADLSFRSAVGAARRVLGMLSEGWMVALVKPQFEIDPGTPGFDGVIRDEELLAETLGEVATRLEAADILTLAAAASPIRGRRGNREFLFLLARPAAAGPEAAEPEAAGPEAAEPETAGLPEAGPLDSEGVVRACLSEQAEGRGGGTP
jgi:23S rRNA (cytidine1920-2'-O)/16S rRNA (cytidine1409-2'-O)-methyltransferase